MSCSGTSFHEEWNDLGELRGLLLRIRETGYVFSFHLGRTIGCYDVLQHSRSMAHESDGFSRTVHRLNQSDRMFVVGQIPQRPMAARVEHGIKLRLRTWRSPR